MLLKLAFRNILRNRRRSLFTGLSMLVGYMLLVISLSMQEGSYHWILKAYTQSQSGHIQINHPEYIEQPTLYKTVNELDELLTWLKQFDWITHAVPRIEGAGLVYGEQESSTLPIMGIDVENEAKISTIKDRIAQGEYFKSTEHHVILGAQAAKQLNANIGDSLVIISQAIDGSMANDLFEVVGILENPQARDAMLLYMPLPVMQTFMVMENKAHRVLVNTADYRQADFYAQTLNNALQRDFETIQAHTWKQVEKEFYRTMQADKQGNQVSIYIIVFLVCLGVLNTILMSLLERKGEYGVLRAIGAGRLHLFNMIMLEALMLCAMCCFVGLLAVIPINIFFTHIGVTLDQPMDISGIAFTALKGTMEPWVFTLPFALMLMSTALLTMVPAIRAARIKPLDGMRAL